METAQPTELRSIGIRVTPNEVHYAVVAARPHGAELLTCSYVLIPPALEVPDQLSFVRTTLLDIMAEYGVQRAGIRVAEYTGHQMSVPRLNLEGVVQELLSSSGVESFFVGRIATIASLLGERDRSRIKEYFAGETFMAMDEWPSLSLEKREAVVVAVAALRLHPTQ